MNHRRAILVYLRADRRWPTSSADLASELLCSWRAVCAELRKMERDGLVSCKVRDGQDEWSLTPKGREVPTNRPEE